MNVKRFIRSIILFPFSIMMGIECVEASTAAPTDAGAAPATATAEAQGSEVPANPDTTGAAPETGTAEGQGGEGKEAPGEGAPADRAPHQKTFEERVEEVATKKVQELERKLEAKQTAAQVEKPNFINLNFDAINQHLAGVIAREKDLQDQIALDPQNSAALVQELFHLQSGREQLIREVRENEQRKGEYLQKAKAQQQDVQRIQELNTRIVEASEIIRIDSNIPPEVWKKGEEWFDAERRAKPLIDAQYREKVMLQGPMTALLWAKEYVEKNMGAKEQQLIDTKEAAKQTLPPGKTATGAVVGNPALDALKAKAQQEPTAENLAAYSRAKREAAKQQ